MVQRKVTKKPGNSIRGDHLVPEKLANGSNKGTELKKKMKKSRSIKLSDVEGLRPSSPSRKSVAQPGKLPPLNVLPPAVATPQKKSMIKAVDRSPNYMKSTSSSKAKKESSKVSFPTSLTGSNSKNLHRSSIRSKTSSGSCNKSASARTLTRTSSFNLVRTLRKSPSFKLARASAKKCSKVALSADMNNVHGATCSSTLKDSKFPPYLMLNNGTESEGTSVIKVCPYTYCSLNGHHRTPLPPLKCFLKAKRRSMKTQRSMRMEALSPRRRKVSGDGRVHTSNGVDLDISPSPLMKEEPMDILFIEIYAKNEGNDAEATQGSTQMNGKGINVSEYVNETAVEHDIDTLVSESSSEGSPHSEIDFDEHFEHCDEIISKVDDDITKTFHEELKNLTEGDEQKGVLSVDVDLDRSTFDVIDIDWEEWQFSASEPDYEARSSMESDLDAGDSTESRRNNLHDEFLNSSDESDIKVAKEVPADGAEQFVEEDIACTDTCSQISETLCYNQVSSTEEMFELLLGAMEEENEDYNVIQKPGDSGADQTTVMISDLCSENNLPSGETEAEKVADVESLIGIHDSSRVLPEAEEDDIKVEENLNSQLYEVNNAFIDEKFPSQDTVDESHDHLSDGQHENAQVVDNQTALEEDQDEAKFSFTRRNAKEELPDNHNNRQWTTGCKRHEEICEEEKKFNPRGPNFLPVVPDPDAEKVDLRHQMMDERKNAEEWMLDHALRQAVTKLAPTRKRKVALLVEAFETVLPVTKCETRLRHTSTGFAHGGKQIQACN